MIARIESNCTTGEVKSEPIPVIESIPVIEPLLADEPNI